MIEKSDWQAASASLIAEARKRVEPPTAEEIEAYFEGALPDDEAARVRDLLVYFPELARVMTQVAPDENVQVLTEFERAQDWAAFRRKIGQPRRQVARAALAAAALAGVVFVGIAVYRSRSAEPPPRTLRAASHQFRPDGVAGSVQRPIQIQLCDQCTFRLLSAYAGEFPSYRIDLLDLGTTPPRVVVSRPGIHRDPTDGAFVIAISGDRVAPGFYRLELYGVRGSEAERQAVYTFEVTAP